MRLAPNFFSCQSDIPQTYPASACSKSTAETTELYVKSVQG